MPKISAKRKRDHPQWRRQMRLGRFTAGVVAENWQLSACGVVNLARSQVYHTELPLWWLYVFAAQSPWCSALRGFVSHSWSLLYLGLPAIYSALNAEHYYSCLLTVIWPANIAVLVTSSFWSSEPNSFFYQKPNRFRGFFGGEPQWTESRINSADP